MSEQAREWSRSRYWLCHFLNSRHRRRRIDRHRPWCPLSLARSAQAWLASIESRGVCASLWLGERAAADYANDPAFVQSLRLLIKEDKHLADTLTALRPEGRVSGSLDRRLDRASRPVRQFLGVRFELSIRLLVHLTDAQVARRVACVSTGTTLEQLALRLEQERQDHVSFESEWLTREFADFNFIRRNLRRWRMRAMFAAWLTFNTLRHRRLLRAAGTSVAGHWRASWQQFGRLLERMVPYHRAALLTLLLEQTAHPYDKPASPM